jgi:hypothetical protein
MRKRGMSSGYGDDDRREWIAFLALVPYLECGRADAHASARIRRCLPRFAPKLHRVQIRLQSGLWFVPDAVYDRALARLIREGALRPFPAEPGWFSLAPDDSPDSPCQNPSSQELSQADEESM